MSMRVGGYSKRRHGVLRPAGSRVPIRRRPSSNGVGSRGSFEDRAYLLRDLSARAQSVLCALSEEPTKAVEIARRTGIPAAAVRGVLMTLSRRGFAEQNARGRWWRIERAA